MASRLGSAVSAVSDQLSISIAAGDNRILAAICSLEHFQAETIDSVDYGGQSLTLAVENQIGSGNHNVVAIWYLLESGIAAASDTTLQQTTSGTVDYEIIAAQAYEDVAQAVPVATNSIADDTSPPNPATFDLTESDGGIVVAGYTWESAGTVSWNASMNELSDDQSASSTTSMADRLSTTDANVDIEATASSAPSRVVGVSAAWASAVVPISVEQEGYRFRDDDGSESAASWRQLQDVVDSADIGEQLRLRILVNGSGDPDTTQYKLQYREKSSSAGWRSV